MHAAPQSIDEPSVDRVDELLSMFFDDCLSDQEVNELNGLLLADPAARDRCVEAAQLHADLLSILGGAESKASMPDLGALLSSTPLPAV